MLFTVLLPVCPAWSQEAGEIVSALGVIEVWREGRWQPIGAGETVTAGEMLKTGEGSRIALQLTNGSQLKLNANAQLELKRIAPKTSLTPASDSFPRNILRLLGGEVWIRGNNESLEIQTLPATATVRGTEFNLAVDPGDFARLAVLEGAVELANRQGNVLVAANEQATAKAGEAPRKTV
ncbi:MAG TPA: FecR family protein, partial [Candidatus Competibacter sp.]|nr:FecR family protein [Candidatus Competibacter sp.]